MTNNGQMLGGAGGVGLVILGSILLGRGGMGFIGLVAVLVGIGLVVRTLLQLTDTTTTGSRSGVIKVDIGDSTNSHDRVPPLGAFLSFERVKRMPPTNQWAAGAIMGIIALVGLFLFSRAGDGMFALFGGVLFLFGLGVIVVFVHQATDYSSPAEPAAAAPANSPEPSTTQAAAAPAPAPAKAPEPSTAAAPAKPSEPSNATAPARTEEGQPAA